MDSGEHASAGAMAPLKSAMRVGIAVVAAFPALANSPATGPATLWSLARQGCFEAMEVGVVTDACYLASLQRLRTEAKVVVDVDVGEALYRSAADLASLDAPTRRYAVSIVCAAVDRAAEIGSARVSVISGPDPMPGARRLGMEALVKSILEIYEHAKAASDVEVALKMADRTVDKRFLIGPTADGVEIAERVRRYQPGFGLVLNLGHLPLLAEDIESAVTLSAPYLARADIGNCVLRDHASPWYGDRHPQIGLPGGEIGVPELARFLGALAAVGYLGSNRGIVTFEVRPGPGDDPWEVVEHGQRALTHAWDIVRGER
jgi:sugar phosphate isomerase/epimerase